MDDNQKKTEKKIENKITQNGNQQVKAKLKLEI